jgi:integrase
MRIHSDDRIGIDQRVTGVLLRYLKWSVANHSKATHYRVKLSIESFSQSLPAGMRLRSLLPLHLTEWLDCRCPKASTSDNTRHDYAADVLGAFNWAVKQRLIVSSPLQGFTKAPKTPRITYLAPEQSRDLLAKIRDRQFRDFLTVTLRTGCRPQEARVLEARFIMLEDAVARIPKELAKGKRKERLVPLDDTVLDILRPLILKYPEGPLLRNTRGTPWTRNAIKDRFRRLNLPYKATAYSMRHTFVNEARRNGASDGAIATVCGHEDKTMVLRVYGHAELQPDLLRDTVRKANQRLKPS